MPPFGGRMEIDMKRIFSGLLLGIFFSSLLLPAAQAATLTDLQNHWSAGDVNKLISQGAVGGYPDYTFRPDTTITRAEFSKILRQSLGLASVEGNGFSDTINHWAITDINTLVRNQIIIPAEYGKQYGPDSAITRREIAIMLVRALGLNGSAVAFSGRTTEFSDDADINSYDKGYLYLAKELELVSGYEDRSFQPNHKATRAEACVMIVRLLDLKKSNNNSILGEQMNTSQQQDKPSAETEKQQTTSSSDKQTLNNVQYQLSLTDTNRSNRNNINEQYVYATLQLTINNQTNQAITLSNENLQTIVTYSGGAQVTANQQAFTQTVAAGQTKTINTTVNILLPDNPVANMVLGNKISNIATQLNIANQSITFSEIDKVLLNTVQ